MSPKTALAVAATRATARPAAPAARGSGPVDALRRHLASRSAREHVVLDFLEDDLTEIRGSLGEVSQYLSDVEGALGDAETDRDRLLGLALGRGPLEQLEYLSGLVQNLRRRLVQVSTRMGR